ncbi:beta-alanine-activating enzyme-like [Haliotis rufescens]|uniref:beta-alanine-activating enzyme-like n=1 Tax=Haliotis rufescens TaxID=6454 RepID=UPI00201EE4D0|nr:beta-alanine-activating enzyme-like [Haliotis rufescens]
MMETLHGLVEKQISEQSYKVAVQFDDGVNKSFITYQDLCNTANIVSEVLRSSGVDNETVGLCVPPNIHLPSVLLGILQTPASFFPFDSDGSVYLRQALPQVGVRFLLVDVDHLQRLEDVTNTLHGAVVPCMELFELGLVLVSLRDILPRPQASSLAYCITTSGTTSVPKVVRVPHSCIVPNIQHLRKIYELNSEDLCFLASPLTFDPSIVEIFVTLTSGATLLMTNNEVKASPKKLLEILYHRNRVSVLQMTPSLLLRFGPSVLKSTLLSQRSSVRTLALGGENLPTLAILRSAVAPDCRATFYNLYGVTEVSCWATCFRFDATYLEQGEEGPIPLGAVLDGTEVKVTDSDGHQVTCGEGRLQIGSSERVCLLNAETEAVLESLPVWRDTGDIVYVRDDGTITYIGRYDDQIKRHGKRLNTSAIQHAVQQLPAIIDSRVLSLADRLLLFVVTDSPCEEVQHASLKMAVTSHLQKTLPSHYQPDQVMLVEQIPLTKHGKTDTKLLATLWEEVVRRSPTLPLDVRRWCTSLWQDHLHPSGNSRDILDMDEFLALGGNSLQAVSLVNMVEDQLGHHGSLLLDTVLNKTFLDFVQHVQGVMASVQSQDAAAVSGDGKSEDPEPVPATIQSQDAAAVSGDGKSQDPEPVPATIQSQDAAAVSGDGKSQDPEPVPATIQSQDAAAVSWEGKREDPEPVPATIQSQDAAAVSGDGKSQDPEPVPATSAHPVVSEPVSADITEDVHDGSKTQMKLEGCWTEHMCCKFAGSVSRGSKYQGTVRLSMASVDPGATDIQQDRVSSQADFEQDRLLSRADVQQDRVLSRADVQQDRVSSKADVQQDRVSSKADVQQDRVSSQADVQQDRVSSPEDFEQCYVSRPTGVEWDRVLMNRVDSSHPGVDQDCVSMSLCWKYDTEKCVDASPLVAVSSTGSHVVYIGSHSHLMCAIDLKTGCELWRKRLGDRVESSACLSQCGRWVVVGCYDNCVYVLCAVSGDIKWIYKTHGCVKSSPTLDPITSHIIIGSHDGCLHSVDIYRQRCVWRQALGAGSVFSSPCVSRHRRHVYVGTLGSNLHAVNPDTGDVLWSRDTTKPVFSSPAENHNSVIVGCVDGSILCFNHQGDKIWTFSTDGPVFSSPLIITPPQVSTCTSTEPEDVVLVGSHDKHLYCLTMTGQKLWRWAADSAVYTTPFVWHQGATQEWRHRNGGLASWGTSLEEELHYQTELSNGIALPSATHHMTFSSDLKLADSVKQLLVDHKLRQMCKCSLHGDKRNDCKLMLHKKGLYNVSRISSMNCVTCSSGKHKTFLSMMEEPCVKKQRFHIDNASHFKVPVYKRDLFHAGNQQVPEPCTNSSSASCQNLSLDISSKLHPPVVIVPDTALSPQPSSMSVDISDTAAYSEGKGSGLNLCLDGSHIHNNQTTPPTSQQISGTIDQHLKCLPKGQLPSDSNTTVHDDTTRQAQTENIPCEPNSLCTHVRVPKHPCHCQGSQGSSESLPELSSSGPVLDSSLPEMFDPVFDTSLSDESARRTITRECCGYAVPVPVSISPGCCSRTCRSQEGSAAPQQDVHPVVYVASTSGNLTALCVATGQQLASTCLPGEVFSSPIVVDGRLVVGCRDNNIYCFTVVDI